MKKKKHRVAARCSAGRQKQQSSLQYNKHTYYTTLNYCLQYKICVQKGKKMQAFSKNVNEYSNYKLSF